MPTRLTLGAALVLATLAIAGCTAVPGSAGPAPSFASSTASSTASPTASSTGSPTPAAAPPDLAAVLLPDEGGRSSSPDVTDWTTDRTAGQAWLLDPCAPTDYPTDRQRTSFRTVSRTGPEMQDARQLGVYPTPEVAAEVLAGFRRALAACSTGTSPNGIRWQWVAQDLPALGDDGLLAASAFGGGQSSPAGSRIAVTRVGAAVFLAHGGGEYGTAELDGGVDDVRSVAQRFIDSL